MNKQQNKQKLPYIYIYISQIPYFTLDAASYNIGSHTRVKTILYLYKKSCTTREDVILRKYALSSASPEKYNFTEQWPGKFLLISYDKTNAEKNTTAIFLTMEWLL